MISFSIEQSLCSFAEDGTLKIALGPSRESLAFTHLTQTYVGYIEY